MNAATRIFTVCRADTCQIIMRIEADGDYDARMAASRVTGWPLSALTTQAKPNAPECPYCSATEGLRYKHRGYGPVAPEVTCEGCFTPRDDGPCFDDLPVVPAQVSA